MCKEKKTETTKINEIDFSENSEILFPYEESNSVIKSEIVRFIVRLDIYRKLCKI